MTSALEQIAAWYGIRLTARTGEGEPDAADDALRAILTGARISLPASDQPQAVQGHLAALQGQEIMEPVLIKEESEEALLIPIRLQHGDNRQYDWTLTEENGASRQGEFRQNDLQTDTTNQTVPAPYNLCLLDVGPPPAMGYHHFSLRLHTASQEGAPAQLQLIITPTRSYVPPGLGDGQRLWGLSCHLHAVRSRTNWGYGDFSDLLHLLNRSAAQGAATLHTTPLNACRLAPDTIVNPYSPSCRSLLNILHIDIEAMADFQEWNQDNDLYHNAEFQANLAMIRDQEKIDYRAIAANKTELLTTLWRHFRDNHLDPETERGMAFRRFQKEGGDLLHFYGIFSALEQTYNSDGHQHGNWQSWPREFRDPTSSAITDFAAEHRDEVEYHHYVQWQADQQLAAVGQRSLELGLKVGLMAEMPFSANASGFEAWYYHDLFLSEATITNQPAAGVGSDPAVSQPPLLAHNLKKSCYQPLIAALRANMRYSGALVISSLANYYRTFFSLATPTGPLTGTMDLPFADILGIIALESQRNRCLVIADHSHLLPVQAQQDLKRRHIFTAHSFLQAEGLIDSAQELTQMPAQTLLRAAPPFLLTTKGFWQGHDITVTTAEHLFEDEQAREEAIVARATARAHFLINLDHEHLLPEHHTIDPATTAPIDQPLIIALQLLLARSVAKIVLITINDLLGMETQAEPPSFTRQQFWSTRYPLELTDLLNQTDSITMFKALGAERQLGSVRPSHQQKKKGQSLPRAFYRLQLHKDFTLAQATDLIPYLSRLGISHCYLSPILMARPGSSHGYDIIDHNAINPELGSRADFENFLAVLEQHQMALLLDIVPNHMGVGSDNKWWMDVLENGQASKFAHYFDINWQPQQTELHGRVLVPFLGDYYGKVLEEGLLHLDFAANTGNFSITYYDHRFPLSPRTYPTILAHDLDRLEERLGKDHHGYQELQNLLHSFASLPAPAEMTAAKMESRHRHKEVNKRLLARLCRELPEVRQFIEENVILFNGKPDHPPSFDLLHRLLEQQAYRLAFWRVAADEINYRRFFDINDLAGLRMEEQEVFAATHGLILDLVATGKLAGLRIDHPDGLYHPEQYFCRLQAAAAGEVMQNSEDLRHISRSHSDMALYVVAEKILADFEHLADPWPISGTTGYDFANLVNGLFINPDAEQAMTLSYQHFTGQNQEMDELLYDSKKTIIRSSLAGELNVLASLLYRLAQGDRYTRDFTFNRLREALIEIICWFPVYRTYISSPQISKRDKRFITWATALAKQRMTGDSAELVDFITAVLLLQNRGSIKTPDLHLDFVMKFQQYTGPVMAKGLEDTCFYRYNRLLSLNEVGGDPRRFGLTVAAFHRTNKDQLRHWPHSMLTTSTHDSKHSEDVRARINVLTEIPEQWQEMVTRWSNQNHVLKTQLDEVWAPSAQDEYAFYQNLVGAWPLTVMDEQSLADFSERLQQAMRKASREAKQHTSWVSPATDYEEALDRFIDGALRGPVSVFREDFQACHEPIAWFGMLNSLSQTFLKLVAPGIPDTYQGNEIWRFCLVDPDNRRPVDFGTRTAMLDDLLARLHGDTGTQAALQQDLLAGLADGRAKMYTMVQTLLLRQQQPTLFSKGSYIALETQGRHRHHLCCFARRNHDQVLLAVAPRLIHTLLAGRQSLPLGEEVWQDTAIKLPADMADIQFHTLFAGARPEVDSPSTLAVAELLHSWPVALLHGTAQPEPQ